MMDEIAGAAPIPGPNDVPEREEPSPLDGLLDDIEMLKHKVAQLEQLLVGHGHAFDEQSINQIAQHVYKRINDAIKMRSQPRGM